MCPLAKCYILTLPWGLGQLVRWGWVGFGSIEGTERCWHLRHWCCRSCCRSATCTCTGWRRVRSPPPLIPLRSLTKIRRRRRQFRPTLTITARSARQFSWHRAHSQQRRRNCLSLRISSGSSIPSMSHNRSPGLRGSLSERALRPWRKAAVLLTFLVAGVPFFAPDNSSKQPGVFS